LVTDAQRNGWPAGPADSIRPAADATPAAALPGQDAT
jgi:hypothetical protein